MVKRSHQEKILLGLSGEFAVASHLCLHGYVANLTPKNYPGVDILAFNPKNKRSVAIQVKAKLTELGGEDYFLHEKINDEDPPFVFVEFATKDDVPQFFVVSAKDVAEISERERESYIKAHPDVKKEQPRMISLRTIQEFKDQWQSLGLD